MTTQPGTRRTIADYLAIAKRYRALIALTAIVVPMAAYLVSVQQPKSFEASADVLLNRQDPGCLVSGLPCDTQNEPERYAETQATLARVPEVAESAVESADVDGVTAGELLASTSVTPRANTDLLIVSVRHGDPDAAMKLAAAYATAFTTYTRERETANVTRARLELQGRLAELRDAGGTDSDVYRELSQQFQSLRTLELLQAPAAVVRTPTYAVQVEPRPTRNAVLGLLLGLMLGAGGAILLNALDRRIRDADEIERELQIPLLAKLPGPRRRNDRLLILDRPADEVTEAVGRLRTSFDFANSELQARVVMATSAGAREGKSTTVANLAIALSRTGRRVVLVDLDLRRPSLFSLFHLPNQPGITDLASGRASLSSVLNRITPVPLRLAPRGDRESGTGTLEVVTSGRLQLDPGEFVETSGLSDALQQLRNHAEIVLVDAPPILAAGDAMALTGKVDAILLVNRLGSSTRQTLVELVRTLGRSPKPVMGFVATDAELDEAYSTYHQDEVREARERSRWLESEAAQADAESPLRSTGSATGGRWSPKAPGG